MGMPHAHGVARERPSGEFPPGVVCYRKEPQNANPLLQAWLPGNFKHENKRSKAVSFLNDGGVTLVRGTTRTYAQAERICLSWAWSWWDTLSVEQKSAIQTSSSEPPSKKRKVN